MRIASFTDVSFFPLEGNTICLLQLLLLFYNKIPEGHCDRDAQVVQFWADTVLLLFLFSLFPFLLISPALNNCDNILRPASVIIKSYFICLNANISQQSQYLPIYCVYLVCKFTEKYIKTINWTNVAA